MVRRVVITGTGVVSSIGIGTKDFWESIKKGRNGISTVTGFDVSDYPTQVAAEIKSIDLNGYIEPKEAKRMDKSTQYAMIAAKQAVEESCLDVDRIDNLRFGVIIGSGFGGFATYEKQHQVLLERGPGRISPFALPMTISNASVAQVGIRYKAKGYNSCIVTACASGNNAIGEAYRMIHHDYADVMIAGGTDATITPLGFATFCSMKAMSRCKDPDIACRPFDSERDGFVMGEGSGILIIEELAHALERDAEIVAEIVGYGCTSDAYSIVAPALHGEGGARCMSESIRDAGINIEDIDYINAHGTSTKYNDQCETEAIKAVFRDYAMKIPVSSTKSMTGHMIGAAGAVEAIITSCALKEGFLPPTCNYSSFDEECDLDYVPNKGRSADINYAISNSFGFGGHNACLAFKKYTGN